MDLLQHLQEEQRMKLRGGLYHQTQVKLAYNSNRIEGSRLSEEQTRCIFETNTLDVPPEESADVDDIVETANHFACFDFMLEHAAEPLTEGLIKELHRILKSSTSDARKAWFRVGDYKSRPNVVGDAPTAAPGKVAAAIQALLADYAGKQPVDLQDILEFHVRFERIHPFQDGNGRVGRLLLFKECLRHDVMPFIIDHEHKLFYYRGLKEYDTEPGYLTGTCQSAQDHYVTVVRYFYPELGIGDEPEQEAAWEPELSM